MFDELAQKYRASNPLALQPGLVLNSTTCLASKVSAPAGLPYAGSPSLFASGSTSEAGNWLSNRFLCNEGDWKCANCTQKNLREDQFCPVCETPNPRLPFIGASTSMGCKASMSSGGFSVGAHSRNAFGELNCTKDGIPPTAQSLPLFSRASMSTSMATTMPKSNVDDNEKGLGISRTVFNSYDDDENGGDGKRNADNAENGSPLKIPGHSNNLASPLRRSEDRMVEKSQVTEHVSTHNEAPSYQNTIDYTAKATALQDHYQARIDACRESKDLIRKGLGTKEWKENKIASLNEEILEHKKMVKTLGQTLQNMQMSLWDIFGGGVDIEVSSESGMDSDSD